VLDAALGMPVLHRLLKNWEGLAPELVEIRPEILDPIKLQPMRVVLFQPQVERALLFFRDVP
jgi:hypothetical protein